MSDAPDDSVRMVLEVPLDLVPDWVDVIKDLAAGHVRRMGIIERDDKWVVLCDLPPQGRPAFAAALQEAWTTFQEQRTP